MVRGVKRKWEREIDHPTSLDLLFLPSSVERKQCSSVCFCHKEDPPLFEQLSLLLKSDASFHGDEIMVSEAGLAMDFSIRKLH